MSEVKKTKGAIELRKAERIIGLREVLKNLPLKQKILAVIMLIFVTTVIVFSVYWIATSLPLENRFEADTSDPTIFSILVLAILFFVYFLSRIFRSKIRFEKTAPAGAFESDEFRRTFPTCPICSSGLGYEATRRFLTFYVRCRNCGAVWEKIVKGLIWKTELRYLLVEPDKEMRASSLVGKGDVEHGYFEKTNWGYEVEFWKVLDYVNRHRGEISIPQAGEELGLSEARLKATVDKLKRVYKAKEK